MRVRVLAKKAFLVQIRITMCVFVSLCFFLGGGEGKGEGVASVYGSVITANCGVLQNDSFKAPKTGHRTPTEEAGPRAVGVLWREGPLENKYQLGPPVVPFYRFFFGGDVVPLLK